MTNDEPKNRLGNSSGWIVDPDQDGSKKRLRLTSGKKVYQNKNSDFEGAQTSSAKRTGQSQQEEVATATSSTASESSTPGTQVTEDLYDDTLGHVSKEWKNAFYSYALGVGAVLLFIGILVVSPRVSNTVTVFSLVAMSLLYLCSRFGFSYFLYKDAKAIAYHSRERRQNSTANEIYGWTPKPRLWAMGSFFLPPFVEIGVGAAYLVRRHERVGVP